MIHTSDQGLKSTFDIFISVNDDDAKNPNNIFSLSWQKLVTFLWGLFTINCPESIYAQLL